MDTPSVQIPDELCALVAGASRVVVVTGAGISAASGIRTYRDRGSGWSDSAMEEKSRASRYGNHLPELWEFWSRLHESVSAAEPNAAHLALAEWEEVLAARGGSLQVATQNIDGLHQRGGSSSVAELHGSILRTRCMRCLTRGATVRPHAGGVPACTHCGGSLRPDVVLFEEALPRALVESVEEALRRCDLCVYVGTSGEVWPVAGFVSIAHRAGAACILVNRDPWDSPAAEFSSTLLGGAEEILPALVSCATR